VAARWGIVVIALLCSGIPRAGAFPSAFPTNGPVAARFLERWIQRLEARVEQANRLGVLSEDKREELYDGIRRVKIQRDEAVRDSVVTVAEREAIRSTINHLNVEIAEARFGHHEPAASSGNAGVAQRRARPREPADAPGTVTVAPAL
jgi:hypothetical protein